ncbi:MAG: hypothetical protein HZA54_18725 [Planctomycetes bacterium]|nr:hypothetical protein [Planctomycetota bacterium]
MTRIWEDSNREEANRVLAELFGVVRSAQESCSEAEELVAALLTMAGTRQPAALEQALMPIIEDRSQGTVLRCYSLLILGLVLDKAALRRRIDHLWQELPESPAGSLTSNLTPEQGVSATALCAVYLRPVKPGDLQSSRHAWWRIFGSERMRPGLEFYIFPSSWWWISGLGWREWHLEHVPAHELFLRPSQAEIGEIISRSRRLRGSHPEILLAALAWVLPTDDPMAARFREEVWLDPDPNFQQLALVTLLKKDSVEVRQSLQRMRASTPRERKGDIDQLDSILRTAVRK